MLLRTKKGHTRGDLIHIILHFFTFDENIFSRIVILTVNTNTNNFRYYQQLIKLILLLIKNKKIKK